MTVTDSLTERSFDRRQAERRSLFERRGGERRDQTRAHVGRRVLFVSDRRDADRRLFERRGLQLQPA
jgi:hypothetical protein